MSQNSRAERVVKMRSRNQRAVRIEASVLTLGLSLTLLLLLPSSSHSNPTCFPTFPVSVPPPSTLSSKTLKKYL